MDKQHRKNYEAPTLYVVAFKTESGFASSSLSNTIRLGDAWTSAIIDAWIDGGGSVNNLGVGWIDNGENAWD